MLRMKPQLFVCVTSLCNRQFRAQASDIHFEPLKNEFRIRYRVDGACMKCPRLRKAFGIPVISTNQSYCRFEYCGASNPAGWKD